MNPSQYPQDNRSTSEADRNMAMQSLGIIPGDSAGQIPPAPKKKPKMMFAIVALIFSVVIAVVLSVLTSQTNSNNTDETGVSFAATTLNDYSRVCNGAIVTNAAKPTTDMPRNIIMFEKAANGSFIQSSMTTADATWLAEDTSVNAVTDVGCIERKQQTPANTVCKMIDNKDAVRDVPQYNVTYQVLIVAASSGEKLGSTELTSKTQPCPILPIVDSSSTAVYNTIEPADMSKALEGLIQN